MLSKGQRTYLEKTRKELITQIQQIRYLNKSNTLDLTTKKPLENQLHKTDHVIKNKAKKALEDLTLIAEMIPEKQKAEIFTKDSMRGLIKAIFKDGDGKRFSYGITDEEIKSNWPEPIYNKRIFNLGILFADFGISSAYSVVSWRQRIRDINHHLTKGEMCEIIGHFDNYKYILEENDKK